MITKAHYDSKQFVIDPAYSIHGKNPADQNLASAPYWHYGHYECEAFLLEKMIRRKNEAKLKVGYTKNRRTPAADAYFSLASDVAGTIEFRASGSVEALFNGKKIYAAPISSQIHRLSLAEPGKLVIHLHTDDPAEDIPALLPLNVVDGWLYSADGVSESEPVCRPQREDGLPPHLAELPQVPLTVHAVSGNVWDAGVQLLCYIDIESDVKPELFVGESIPEMENNDSAEDEQTRELVKTGANVWTSRVPLALRYIRLEGAVNPKITLRALFHPAEYQGAFAVQGQDDLTKIWMNAAYTLHLCMHNFLLDGIKRDRLPWAGDLAVSLMGNAYSFGDGSIVRDSLSVLGATGITKGHINDIVDYTMWWLINHELYQKYFCDPDFLRLEYPRITETLDLLLAARDENGFYPERKGDWWFIDWVPGKKCTAVQILFAKALLAGAGLADRMNDSARAEMLRAESEKLQQTIRRLAFSKEKGLFEAEPGSGEFTRHANLLAVVTGMAQEEEKRSIADALKAKDLPPVGTPYMSVFEAMAIAQGGDVPAALAKIREIWGGMLSLGATTFWEGFNPDETGLQHYVFYDRPFGKSLCHAWGSGPLFLLPQLLLGLEPVSDGWKTFRLNPAEGLTCAMSVPTPQGIIEAEIENGKIVKLTAPEDCIRVD